MRPLPKHMRRRRRYLAVRLGCRLDRTLDERGLQRALWATARRIGGARLSAETELRVMRFEAAPGVAVALVRTPHAATDAARGVLAAVDVVGDTPVAPHVVGVCGTIAACEERYMNHATRPVDERDVAFDSHTRTAFVRGAQVDIVGPSGDIGATRLDLE